MLKRIISVLLMLVVIACVVLMFDLPYELRFIEAQNNYLFVGSLYLSLAVLAMTRIMLIEDRYSRRALLVLGLMIIVFPCSFVFSIALENFYRVKRNNGIDAYFELTAQTKDGNFYQRTYQVRDENLLEINGLVLSSRKNSTDYYSGSSSILFPTKRTSRKEKDINTYFKLIVKNNKND